MIIGIIGLIVIITIYSLNKMRKEHNALGENIGEHLIYLKGKNK
jgi:Na+/H+ antiporter NhaB